MSESKNPIVASVSWGVVVTLAGALVTWGVTANRLDTLEKQATQSQGEYRDLARQVNAHDKQIAVIQLQLDTIIRQLNEIGDKLERIERRRQ